MSIYEFWNANLGSRIMVVLCFDLDTSGSHNVSWMGEFIEWKSRPLCCLHRHEITCRSTIEQHVYSC